MAGIYVKVKNKEQLEAVIGNELAGTIICGFSCMSELSSKNFIKDIKKYNKKSGFAKEIFVSFPEVEREDKLKTFEKNLELIRMEQVYCDGVIIENLDELGMLKAAAYRGKVIGGSFLYAYNSDAVRFYKKYFKEMRFIAPDELTINEIRDIEKNLNRQRFDKTGYSENIINDNYAKKIGNIFIYKVYGHQPVMITNQCMNKNYCGCMKPKLEFRDDKNNNFYITSECGTCHDIIYNGPVTYMLDKLEEIGDRELLLDFTVESGAEVKQVMELLEKALSGNPEKIEKYTRGHYYKGID